MKPLFIALLILLFFSETSLIKAQELTINDPLLSYKKFYEVGISLNETRVNTNYTTFKTKNGIYNFEKGKFLPTIDGIINFGWLFKDQKNGIMTLKTGINLTTRGADLTDSIGTNLRFNEGFIKIPIQFGFRLPKKFNTFKNNLFRAIEYNIGVYTAIPYYEKLDLKNNLDSNGNISFGNYLRFGVMSEITFTALNEKGNGHKFGIRASIDFKSIAKIKNTKNELYPIYSTIGIFYNILNRYK